MKKMIIATMTLILLLFIGTSSAVEINLLGPNRYERTKGAPNAFADTFVGKLGPGRLIIQNGEVNGENRVSSALILLNGKQVMAPNGFNQEVSNLEIPVSLSENNSIYVELRSKPASYLTIQVKQEGINSTEIVDPQGGVISIKNYKGDIMSLEIPPLALSETVSISITALSLPPPNPIANNIFPGAILEPSGLIFGLPVKFRVAFQEPILNPDQAMLFWVKDNNLAVPIANQSATQYFIEGDIFHFSEIVAATPTVDEIWNQIMQIVISGGDPSALGILETIDDYLAIMRHAQTLRNLGQNQKAEEAENAARGMLEERSLAVLSTPLPEDPCGNYSSAIIKLNNLILSALGDASLAQRINERSCTLSISPVLLNLFLGEPWILSATLFDPKDNQKTCSSLNWSADLNFIEVLSIENQTYTIKGINKGPVIISANCDGLIGYSNVNVVDLTGTWFNEEQDEYNSCGGKTLGRGRYYISQTGNYLKKYNIENTGTFSGQLMGRQFTFALDAPFDWPNTNCTFTKVDQSGSVSSDGFYINQKSDWTYGCPNEEGDYYYCTGWTTSTAYRLTYE